MTAGPRLVVLALLVTLAGVAAPPTVENHVEPGFCSADCPVQHDGQTNALPASVQGEEVRLTPVVIAQPLGRTEPSRAGVPTPDAPRAPPAA